MKKALYKLLIVAVSAVSCDKDFFGSESSPAASESYLESLSTKFIPDCLKALEYALNFNGYGYYTGVTTSEYETGDKDLTVVGTEWTVRSISAVKDVVITCTATDTWDLSWTGNHAAFPQADEDEKPYVTICNISAKKTAEVARYHYNWEVTVTCTRQERKGYACTMTSAPTMEYTTSSKSYVWDSCDGSAIIDVTRNGVRVDYARMDYMGTSHRYFRGLD